MRLSAVLEEGFELLRWSVLAASTIGPGTVIVCSKAGADYALTLLWALVLASFVAYALQEAPRRCAARRSVGPCAPCGAAARTRRRWLLRRRGGVLLGNTAYQANNFVGAAEALYALGAPRSDPGVRFLMHLACGLAVLGTLFFADVDRVSAGLGVVSVLMIVTFAFALSQLGLDGGELVLGLLPSKPPGSGIVAVSMVATTAIPFNAFLASCAAKPPDAGGSLGAAVSGMRRGVTLATAIALVLSVLIVATGAGVARHVDDDGAFSVESLVDALRAAEGGFAVACFGLGLYAAAFSSALTVALGAALCCASLLAHDDDDRRWRQPDGPYTRGVIVFVVLVAVVVGSSGASTVGVVLMAQVINGVLLPVVALCLVLCYNDPAVLRAPPPAFRNASQVACFSATAFLATNGLLSKILSDDASLDAAFVMAFLATAAVCVVLRRMRRRGPARSRCGRRRRRGRRSRRRRRTRSACARTPTRRPAAAALASTPPMTPHGVRISPVFLEDDEDDVA
ncbi:hypothetical protein JL722_1970 [Aureococcus anophagefferens]|nr:hypothetical protein JL722_1970 [Aureococcus anophagefferens]